MSELFPIPRYQKNSRRSIDCSQAKWIILGKTLSGRIRKQALKLVGKLNGLFKGELALTQGVPEKGMVLLEIGLPDHDLPEQGFKLFCKNNRFHLTGGDDAGVFYGMGLFQQLAENNFPKLPCLEITDYPDLPVRGYMLDISRGKVPQMSELLKLADLLSALRYNQLQLYTEHTFAYSAHSLVWRDFSPMTPEQIIELDLYCKDHFIELVPNQNAFGHLRRWLKHKKYMHLAECPDGFTYEKMHYPTGQVLTPDAQSLGFIDSLFGEMLDNFSSDKVNIGADETIELGLGRSKERCEREGRGKVYLDFLKSLNFLTEKYGKKAMFWGDIILKHPELIDQLPKNMIALDWGYEAHSPYRETTAKFAAAGIDFYVCPGTSSWLSLSGRTDVARENIASAVAGCIENHGQGMLLTAWGDGGTVQYDFLNWPGLCYGSAFSWCYEKNKDVNISEMLSRIGNDRNNILGDYLLELGELHHFDNKVKTGNCTIFGLILLSAIFPDPEARVASALEKVKITQLRRCRNKLLALRRKLYQLDLNSPDAQLRFEELLNNNIMIELAVIYMLSAKGCQEYLAQTDELSTKVINGFEKLWVKRNRAGGLNFASGLLRQAGKLLNFNQS